jgi:hypothetical protein
MCLTMGHGLGLLLYFYGTRVGPGWYQINTGVTPGPQRVSKTVSMGMWSKPF